MLFRLPLQGDGVVSKRGVVAGGRVHRGTGQLRGQSEDLGLDFGHSRSSGDSFPLRGPWGGTRL